jgi:endoglucanase
MAHVLMGPARQVVMRRFGGRTCRLLLALKTVMPLTALAVHGLPRAYAELTYTGVNLSGAEFGEGNLPGTHGTHYIYPSAAEVDYFLGKGMNTIRLPFRWERLQRTLGGEFHATEFNRLRNLVQYATGKGAYVVLDPHNYARYHGNVIGGGTVTNEHFADFWSRLAEAFKGNSRVVFGLMNEPHTMPTEQWLSAANAAIAHIRHTGATNLILVPGNAWSGAHSWSQNWYGTPNATAMLGVVDPGNNFAFEVHQYLDSDSSGRSPAIVSPTIGVQRLAGFTNWLKANRRRGFLGEFAVANSTIGDAAGQIGDEALTGILEHIQANSEVWLGWAWWSAGPWWGDYMFSLEPTNLGQPAQADRPAMGVLDDYFAPVGKNLTGDFNNDGMVDGEDLADWRNGFGTVAPGAVADADGDADVDGADFLLWQASYGTTAGYTTVASVPEPDAVRACLMMLLGVVISISCRPLTRPISRSHGARR